MKVEFFRHQLGEINLRRFEKVMNSIFLTTGEEVGLFEDKFASYLDQNHAVGLTSATAALHLSLLALGVGHGDEVITTPLTFVATSLAIMHVGAQPVMVDVEPETGNIDVSRIGAVITPRTKAIIPVHLYGQMIDMIKLSELARKSGLLIVEDAAHCLEGSRDGIRVGELADAACFSFYATKSITCGEGGAVTTNDSELASKLRKLRLHGMSTDAADRYTKLYRHYDVDVEGWKYNMSNLQAALLMDQIDMIEQWRQRREQISLYYRAAFSSVDGLEMLQLLGGVTQSHLMFTILVNHEKRDIILWALQDEGVGVAVNYRPLHLYTLFREKLGSREGDFPMAEMIGSRTISLPLYPGLQDTEIDFVVDKVKKVVKRIG
jgi:dTDP-4-amino-4,6-dideoxygalactose transaminase